MNQFYQNLILMNKKKAVVISGFPGVGKSTTYTLLNKKLTILDLDCSSFDKSDFPSNYIEYIKDNMDKADIIFVSSQQTVRNALVENKIHFTLYYPSKKRKKEFIKIYKDRGDSDKFIKFVNNNFERLINGITEENEYNKIILENENDFIMNDVNFGTLLKLNFKIK